MSAAERLKLAAGNLRVVEAWLKARQFDELSADDVLERLAARWDEGLRDWGEEWRLPEDDADAAWAALGAFALSVESADGEVQVLGPEGEPEDTAAYWSALARYPLRAYLEPTDDFGGSPWVLEYVVDSASWEVVSGEGEDDCPDCAEVDDAD